jgi:dihydroorotate dehydrogenase electron transfer subunit
LPLTRLHRAAIVSNKPAGRGYFRLVLRAPDAAAAAVPGQFVMLRVSENRDPLLARPFGICSLPSRSTLEIIYRVAGRGTSLLIGMEAGHSLDLLGPIGNGFPLPERGAAPVLVAGGSGFPPLHFFSLRKGLPASVFIGARTRECLPPAAIVTSFRDASARVRIATEDGSAGNRGMASDLLQTFLSGREGKGPFVIYACGPRAMLASVSRIAADHGVPCFVSMEERMACGVGACMGCSVAVKAGGYRRVCKDGPVFDSREIDWSEQVFLKIRR